MKAHRSSGECNPRPALPRALLLVLLAASLCGCDIVREEYYQRTGKSEGTLVANIGMSLAEVAQRSTLKLANVFHYPSGGELQSGQAVFDLELAGTGLRFERCRFYWLMTGKDDARLAEIIVYATPSDWTWDKLEPLQQSMRQKLRADGWQPGRFVYHTPEEQALHAGAGDGYGNYWLKDDVLLMLDPRPTETQISGTDPHAGQFTLYIRIHPLRSADQPNLEFPGRTQPTPAAAAKPPNLKSARD